MNIKLHIKIIYFFTKKYFMYVFPCHMENIIMLVLQPPRIINLPYNVDVSEDQTDELLLHVINVTDDSPSDTVTCDVASVTPVTDIFFSKIAQGTCKYIFLTIRFIRFPNFKYIET